MMKVVLLLANGAVFEGKKRKFYYMFLRVWLEGSEKY
jgi:hypothetical protein